MGLDTDAPAGGVTVLLSLVTLAGLAVLGRYFTLTRRMIAPSIALVVMVALTAVVLAVALLGAEPGWAALFVAGLMAGHYAVFRVPFSAVIIAGAGFFALWAGLAALGLVDDSDLTFSSTINGPFSLMTIGFGLAVFALAMRLDMSDPHRVSTRSATAFWLHVVAAPAIVNTVALNLLEDGGVVAQVWLLVFLLIIAAVAIVIDRRSFLVSGAGYSVALAATLFEGGAAVAILILGLALVLLGALWERLRARLMRALPDFPGKTNLPPYGSA